MTRCAAESARRAAPKNPAATSAVPVMFTLPAAAFCAIVIISVTTQANADLKGFPTARCHVVQIPDVMGIRQCLNGTLNLCGLTKHDRKVASKALGKCLVSSLSTRNFFTVLLGLLRAGLRFALRIAFPGSTSVVYPFWVRVKTFFRRRKQPEASTIIFTSRPCNDTVPVLFPDFLGMADCVHLEHFMCSRTGQMDIGSTLVTSMLSMVVCILKKLPFFNVLRLLREVVCNFLTLVVNFFRNNKRLSFMAPLMELVQIILQCKIEEALPTPPFVLPTAAPELPPTVPPAEVPPLAPPESSPAPPPTVSPPVPPKLYPSLTPEVPASVPSEAAPSVPPEAAPPVPPEAAPPVPPEVAPSVPPEAAPSASTDVSLVPSEALTAEASSAAVKTAAFPPENGLPGNPGLDFNGE
uniref:24 kDa family member n=1 Tax=Rhipicephalus zambeziensis TaxID=60191 RepID=A0A224Y0S3_9ACAR